MIGWITRPDEPGRLVENGAIGCGKVLVLGAVAALAGGGKVAVGAAWLSTGLTGVVTGILVTAAGALAAGVSCGAATSGFGCCADGAVGIAAGSGCAG